MKNVSSSTAGIAFILIVLAGYGLYLQTQGKLTGLLSKIFGYTSSSSSTSGSSSTLPSYSGISWFSNGAQNYSVPPSSSSK